VIPVPVPIPISKSSSAATGLEVDGLAAHRTLGAILASTATTAARCIAVPLVVVVVGMPQQIGVPPIRAGVQVHLGQRHLNQLAVALAVTRGVQPVVEALAHESSLSSALSHALLHALAGYGAAHEVGGYSLSGQDSPEAG